MVESLRELNKICQKPRYREAGNWMVRHILRDAALPVTWLLLHTPVTANQVTLVSLLTGLLGIFFFGCLPASFFLAGALLLQLWYFLDHVDGQIARYRGTASLTGRFFDFLTHHIIHGVIFFFLGFYSFRISGSVFFMLWGALASFSMMIFNLLQDVKYKTFFEKLAAADAVKIRKAEEPTTVGAGLKTAPTPFVRDAFSSLHKLCEIHVLMNLLTAAAILQVGVRPPFDLRFPLFLAYGAIIPVLAVTKAAHWILRRKIDVEFENQFSLVGNAP